MCWLHVLTPAVALCPAFFLVTRVQLLRTEQSMRCCPCCVCCVSRPTSPTHPLCGAGRILGRHAARTGRHAARTRRGAPPGTIPWVVWLHAGAAVSRLARCANRLQAGGRVRHSHGSFPTQVVGEEDRKLQKRLKYLGERMSRRGAQEEGELLLALDLWQAELRGAFNAAGRRGGCSVLAVLLVCGFDSSGASGAHAWVTTGGCCCTGCQALALLR